MRPLLEFLFWTSAGLILYACIGYPLLAQLLARLRPRPVRKADIRPTVSLIISAYNEEKTIGEKLENSLRLRYPEGKLEIVVVADGSSDRTVEIAGAFRERGVRLLHQSEREGKTAAMNRGVAASTGKILFFSDANTVYQPDTVEKLVRSFDDDSVGGVTGRKVVLEDRGRAATDGETAYWSYESALKAAESLAGSIATADGEIFAMRRSLYEPIPRGIVHDDMYLTLKIVENGYRVVYESEATSAEYASRSLYDEFHLKVRYASAGYQIVASFPGIFRPPRSWFAVEFISHKLLRWLAPFFLLGALFSSALIGSLFYKGVFWLQVAFYSIAVLGWALHGRVRFSALYFPLYFAAMNTAALYGFARHLMGGQTTQWRKAER
jgi:biofilm PGA synthesis N-glycosyltransferase PgaC